jgi:hypothetical protein
MPNTRVGPVSVSSTREDETLVFDGFDLPGRHLVLGISAGIRF